MNNEREFVPLSEARGLISESDIPKDNKEILLNNLQSLKVIFGADVPTNKATPTGQVEQYRCESCDNEVMFEMKDNYHTFYISLNDLVECLQFASQEGLIPQIPREYSILLSRLYN